MASQGSRRFGLVCFQEEQDPMVRKLEQLTFTAETLSHWLRHAGTLPRGEVIDLHIELQIETTTSNMVFLTAAYSAEAPADLPRSLVFKSPFTTLNLSDLNNEAQFYSQLAPNIGSPPSVRCLATAEDGSIVLEDIRGTHDHPPWPFPLPPSGSECERALDALALVHAQYWEAPSLGHEVGKLHTRESLTSMVQGIAAHLPTFMDGLSDLLDVEGRNVYERVSAHH